MTEPRHDFVLIFSFARSSLLELASVLERLGLDRSLKSFTEVGAVVESTTSEVSKILTLLGGTNKAGMILSKGYSDALAALRLPERPKFYWTISVYDGRKDLFTEARQGLQELLKKEGLGKSKFIEPKLRTASNEDDHLTAEMDVADLRERIFAAPNPGFDFILYNDGHQLLCAETIETVDHVSFEKRDLHRPFQDPAMTLSPRFARVLVNLSLTRTSRRVLDPFCGLGTILAEAMVLGLDVTGTDRVQKNIMKSRQNLKWITSNFSTASGQDFALFGYNAERISDARIGRVESIATEPLLVPVFKSNPGPAETSEILQKARLTYENCLPTFAEILDGRGSRAAFTSPSIFDSSGIERAFSLQDAARSAGFRVYNPLPARISYPMKIRSEKKRIVHRNLNVFELAA